MNASILRYYIVDLLGGSEHGASADAILAALKLRAIVLDTDNDPQFSATLAVALFPEHARRPLDLTPAEALRVFEGLAKIDPSRAGEFRAERATGIQRAAEARERDRYAAESMKVEAEGVAFAAQKRLAQIRELLVVEQAKIRRIEAQLNGPFQHTMRPALSLALERESALKWEAAGLEKAIAEANDAARAYAIGAR